jgi:hypothetical protein
MATRIMEQAPANAEKRNHRRFSISLPLEVDCGDGRPAVQAFAKNIGSRGMHFVPPRPFPLGTKLECTITLS